MVDKDIWTARAACCELLALSFRYPDAMLAEAVAGGEWDAAAAEIAQALGLAYAERPADDAAPPADADETLHRLRREATRLFVGAPEPAVSPYEGIWRAADDGVQALLFVNPHAMAVERFCESCGLGRPEGVNEPLDHAAAELELMQHLASVAAGLAAPARGLRQGDLPGGSAGAAYHAFARDHAETWLFRFAEAVQAESGDAFYIRAARLLQAFLCNEAEGDG